VLEPGLPIVDAHHHVRDRANDSYLFPELKADLNAGHRILATVAVECGDMYRASGPPALRPVGETEFLAGVAAMFDSGRYGPQLACGAIVGYADLGQGEECAPVLDALQRASGGRLRGIRNPVAWDASPELRKTRHGPEGLLKDPQFQRAVRRLGSRGLSLDAWVYHPQLRDFAALADACPGTTLVLNHLGGPVGAGPYAGKRQQVFAEWRLLMEGAARRPNILCKLGGLGLPIFGFSIDRNAPSAEFAAAWRPYIETAIELFGVERCMFISNFPSDRESIDYPRLWNVFKRITEAYSAAERTALFSATAARVYGLADAMAAAGAAHQATLAAGRP
jgi:L-fuconolactonase